MSSSEVKGLIQQPTAVLTADQALNKVGGFGRYQLYLLLFCNALEWVWTGWPMLLMTFIAAEPPWKCVANSSVCSFNGSIAVGDDNYEKRCNMSREDWAFSDDFTSVVTEFDLVCDKAVYASVSSSLFFAGSLVAGLINSSLADKFGRKRLTYINGAVISFGGLISAFSVNYWMFVAMRLIVGIGIGGVFIFVLVTEFTNPKHRSMMGTALWYCWTLSLMALAGVAYLIRDWRTLTIVTSVPGIPFLLGYFFTPESIRWMAVKGKTDEAHKLLNKVARVNGKEELKEYERVGVTDGSKQRLGDFRDLFATRKLVHRTLLSFICWYVGSMIYYGVYLSAPTVGGDMYLNFFLASVAELPAIYLGIKAYDKFGRKRSIVVTMILSAISSACSFVLTEYGGSGKAALAGRIFFSMVMAKFFIMIAFDGLYIYAAELFPTVIRSIGIGASYSAQSLGSFSAPYVVYSERIHPLLPYGIMGVGALITGIVCMSGPETRNQPTEEVVVRENSKSSSENTASTEVKNDSSLKESCEVRL